MAKPVANLRLFVAIHPPPQVSEGMLGVLAKLSLPASRTTPAEQVHLTLQFIGDTPTKDLDDVIESVQRSAAGVKSFTLTPLQLITLPERGPAQLVAAQTDAPAQLMEVHRRLVARLARS